MGFWVNWWLKFFAEGEELSENYIRQLEGSERRAREIMSAPMITVDASADLIEVADILSAKRIKRVPVVRDGLMVGIVSRADASAGAMV
jgi:CBS domain-containing protein